MSEKVKIDFDVEDIHLEIEGEYSEEMAEKLKRELNTMIYTKRGYQFGFDIGIGLRQLARNSHGVL